MKKIILIVILVSGCSMPQPHWDNATHDRSHLARDEANCQMEKSKSLNTYGQGNPLIGMSNALDVYDYCMQGKDYYLVKGK